MQRTTASGSWSKKEDADFTAVTVAYGVNAAHQTTRHAVFGEVTRHAGSNSIFGRVEMRQSEIAVLTRRIDIDALRRDAVGAFTLGGVHDLVTLRGLAGGVGAAVTVHVVPDVLKPTHGDHPVSFQIFFRLTGTQRMWNMRMSQPMRAHDAAM